MKAFKRGPLTTSGSEPYRSCPMLPRSLSNSACRQLSFPLAALATHAMRSAASLVTALSCAAIAAGQDDVRLVDSGGFQGNVEVLHSGSWRPVCDDYWDSSDARVVCRMVGGQYVSRYCCSHFGRVSNRFWLDDLPCDGSELKLEDCWSGSVP